MKRRPIPLIVAELEAAGVYVPGHSAPPASPRQRHLRVVKAPEVPRGIGKARPRGVGA